MDILLLLVVGSLSCAFVGVSASCNHVFDVRQFLLTEVSSGQELCALSPPSDLQSMVDSVLNCALICQRHSFCESFNYRHANRTCELFYDRPTCYGLTSGCTHYQTQNDQPNAGIPAENCSSPYTYNGKLMTGCGVNLTGDGCNKCLDRNRNITTCIISTPGEYSATFQVVNVTIATITGATSMMSINNWIVIQQRVDASVSFNRSWSDYKSGFGNIATDFWLGLEKMHQLTTSKKYRLRIELQSLDQGKWFSAEYDSFRISPESLFYALNVSGYVGDAGDALNQMAPAWVFQNGMKFSTYDKDNDLSAANFALMTASGFWFNSGFYTDLNAVYATTRFNWVSLSNLGLSSDGQLKTSRMLVKMG